MRSLRFTQNIALSLAVYLTADLSWSQSVTETVLRESPKLSMSLGLIYDSNLQQASASSNQQGIMTRLNPRYKLNDTYTSIGSLGLSQRFTQENRTDLTNMALSVSRQPLALGRTADLRPTVSLILPTNQVQRDIDTLQAALRTTVSVFARTNTPFILETGATLQLNSHQFSISRENGPNLQTRATPYLSLGWTFADKVQVLATQAYDSAWTYRGKQRTNFDFDQSVTYIGGRRWSMTVGHNNSGNLLTADGQHSNVALFDRRSSTVYLSGILNY